MTNTIVLFVLSLTMMTGCVGKFETKPTLAFGCRLIWQPQARIEVAAVPDSRASGGLHVLVFNIHDRLLPCLFFSNDAHTEDEVACIGDLASQFDLVLFQEAFVRPAQIARYTRHAWADHPLFTEGGGGDW